MVLITDDGDFAHRMLSPRHHIPKTYHARLDKPMPADTPARFAEGIELGNGEECKPAQVRLLEEGETPLVEIILVEGKYHQIKRMFASVGCHVDWLKRVKMGELAAVLESLDDFSIENQELRVKEWIESKSYSLGEIMNAFRLALVGEGKGPQMFDISGILGKEETLARLKRAIEVLG